MLWQRRECRKEYTELLGMFSGQYDTITNIPLSVASASAKNSFHAKSCGYDSDRKP